MIRANTNPAFLTSTWKCLAWHFGSAAAVNAEKGGTCTCAKGLGPLRSKGEHHFVLAAQHFYIVMLHLERSAIDRRKYWSEGGKMLSLISKNGSLLSGKFYYAIKKTKHLLAKTVFHQQPQNKGHIWLSGWAQSILAEAFVWLHLSGHWSIFWMFPALWNSCVCSFSKTYIISQQVCTW